MIRTVIALLIVALIFGFLALFVLAGIAQTHGVVEVPASENYASVDIVNADYADAWRADLVERTYKDIDQVGERAFRKGKQIFRNESEVVYQGAAPGLTWQVSYLLDRGTAPNTLMVTTTVRYHNRLGRAYWFLVKPVHRRLTPFRVDQMAMTAPE
jgi:hypothetical protein